MDIRFAKIEDLPKIIEIYNQAVVTGNATADLTEVTADDRVEWFYKHSSDSYPVYIVEIDGLTVAWGSLSPYREGRKALQSTAENSYYVDYSYHGIQIGQTLIKYMINDCFRIGINNLFALLLEINIPSIRILEKFGFEKWGHMPNVVSLKAGKCAHLIYGKNL